MYTATIIVALAAVSLAFPQGTKHPEVFPLVSRVETRDEVGQYALQYQIADGTIFSEQGALKPTPDGEDNVLVKQGSYKFISPEGVPVEVIYTADELGFHPQSSAIPVQQPVPEPVFT